jgi:hypothetical protein
MTGASRRAQLCTVGENRRRQGCSGHGMMAEKGAAFLMCIPQVYQAAAALLATETGHDSDRVKRR